MKRKHLVVLLVVLSLGALLCWHIGPRKMAASESPNGRARIEVREFEISPYSLAGLLKIGEKVYRCEYASEDAPSASRCYSLSGDSFYATEASITWKNNERAYVILGKSTVVEYRNSIWREIPINKLKQ